MIKLINHNLNLPSYHFLLSETSWKSVRRIYSHSSQYSCSEREASSCRWISGRTYL